MAQLTVKGQSMVEEVAARHGVGVDAALTLLAALVAGHGSQAQFSHPELGGMGQWSRGGMTMVGDMFNNALKARVDGLCSELAALLDRGRLVAPVQSQSQSQGQGAPGVSLFVAGSGSEWWPEGLGTPASVGAQNDLRYAYFPGVRRLVLDRGGRVSVHDTGEHQISGVGQQQGGDRTITFTSQLGLVRVADLPLVSGEADTPAPAPPQPSRPAGGGTAPGPAAAGDDDIFAKIERLAELRRKDILTEDEFAAKKAELLARL
jgi:hypothetical protein